MLTEKRQEEIVRLVYERESITVAELKEILHSSESTIRRDIIALDQEGRLTKVFGGAIALRTAQIVNKELSMVQKKDLQIAEKQAIARYDALSHAKRLADKGFHVILIGGEPKSSTDAIVGAEAVVNLQKYHFSKGFFGTNGVEQNGGFTTPDAREAMVKQTAVKNTQLANRYFLATSSKFGKVYAVTFAGFEGGVILTEALVQESLPKSVRVVNVNQPEQ